MRAGVGLERGAGEDGPGAGEFEDGEGVVGERVVERAGRFEKRGDFLRAAESSDDHVHQVGSLFEHGAASETRPVGAAWAGEGGVHGGADEEDIAEPAFLGGVDGGADAWVVPPHVADLEDALVGLGEIDQLAECGE